MHALKRKQYLFFHSYLDIPLILKLAEENYDNDSQTVFIVTKIQLVELVNKIFKDDKSKKVLFLNVPIRSGLVLKQIEEVRYLNKVLRSELTEGNADVYFFSMYYTHIEYYVLEKLKTISGNKIHYCYDPKMKFSIDSETLKSRFQSLVFKLFFGKNISIKASGTQLVSVIEKAFFDDVEMISKEEIDRRVSAESRYFIDYDFQIAFFFSCLDNYEFINVDGVLSLVQKIKQYLVEKDIANKDVGIKYHPFHKRKLFENELENEIPAYIPAQLVRLDSAKIIFSIFSASMFSEIYNDIVKISLIDLVEWNNQEMYQKMKAYLVDNCQENIYFPRAFDELEDILEEKVWRT